jgi:UDP-glucose:glycoprotein glucosyltransferase
MEEGKEDDEATIAHTFKQILEGTEADSYLGAAMTWAERLSTSLGTASQGHVFVNGKHFDMDDDLLKNMQMEAQSQLLQLQESVRALPV